MTAKSRAVLKAENAADFPDNTARLISPADLRGQMDDVVDSAVFPEDGVLAAAGTVNGMTALRGTAPVNGLVIHLNYHTTPGDFGGGQFYGATTGGPYTDNDGTVIVPSGGDGSAAWLRVWDHVKAHVGWFGARCDPNNLATDDYLPAQRCINLFTNGRDTHPSLGTIPSGIVDVGPGFRFSQPLIYGGNLGASFRLQGEISLGRGGNEKSLLIYNGPATHSAIIFYGANEWQINDINVVPLLAYSGVLITADNSYNNAGIHRTTAAITAGSNVVVTPTGATAADRVIFLQPGVWLGVEEGGPNIEIIYITKVDTVAGTFTADFKKNHVTNSLLGGGGPCSSGLINRCRFVAASSTIWTKLSGTNVSLGPGPSGQQRWRFAVPDITGIRVGYPVRVGSFVYAEIVYVDTITPGAGVTGTFEGYANYTHVAGEIVMYPTSGIAFGNRLLGTVQVDNVVMNQVNLVGWEYHLEDPGPPAYYTTKSYAGFRQIWGGNVKAFQFNNTFPAYLRVAFACEQPSGPYTFNGGTTAAIHETIWWNIASTMTVTGWEDEGEAQWLTGLGGSNPSECTFIGSSMQGAAPNFLITGASDEMFQFAGKLTFIGCDLRNNRDFPNTLPIIALSGITSEVNNSGMLTLINTHVANTTLANMNFVRRSPGDSSVDVIKDGSGKFTMINCTGGYGGAVVTLPSIMPALKMWEGRMDNYDPPSMAAGTVGPIVTLLPTPTTGGSVSGAALGDLVEASFSLDLQGATLRAWVSAANTVKFQFAYPLGSTPTPLDLGSGTVKCRVKK